MVLTVAVPQYAMAAAPICVVGTVQQVGVNKYTPSSCTVNSFSVTQNSLLCDAYTNKGMLRCVINRIDNCTQVTRTCVMVNQIAQWQTNAPAACATPTKTTVYDLNNLGIKPSTNPSSCVPNSDDADTDCLKYTDKLCGPYSNPSATSF